MRAVKVCFSVAKAVSQQTVVFQIICDFTRYFTVVACFSHFVQRTYVKLDYVMTVEKKCIILIIMILTLDVKCFALTKSHNKNVTTVVNVEKLVKLYTSYRRLLEIESIKVCVPRIVVTHVDAAGTEINETIVTIS